MTITDNVRRIREIIANSCARAGRNADEVTLIAVSKTHPASAVLEAVEAGVQHFGENRVEEAETKIPIVNQQAPQPVTWHMVGHIQSRKARDVVPLFQCIHSLDSAKLAHRLSLFAVERGITRNVLLEVNVSGEAAKYGFEAAGWDTNPEVRSRLWSEIEPILRLPGLYVCGLMTMAPIVTDQEHARPVFANLAALRRALAESFQISLPDLSMGMTDDYPVAVEEGATLVRIGRAIFGERLKT